MIWIEGDTEKKTILCTIPAATGGARWRPKWAMAPPYHAKASLD